MLACGRCFYDRGMERELSEITTRTTPPRKSYYCTFCDEERHPGGHKVRMFAVEGGQETQVNIPHVVEIGGEKGYPAELKA